MVKASSSHMSTKDFQVHPRFPDSVLKQIDEYISLMEKTMPGTKFSRADAVRSLTVLGLSSLDKKGGKK